MYYVLLCIIVVGDKYERDNIDRQLSIDKAAESIHY